MTKSYAQLQKEIAQLNVQAERLRAREKSGVVEKVRATIQAFGLTPSDLFGAKAAVTKSTGAKKVSSASKKARYGDGTGNTWVGLGKRPDWLRAALAAGSQLSDFEIGGKSATSAGSAPSATKSAAKSAAKSAKPKAKTKSKTKTKSKAASAKYKDDAGNTWVGRGPRPQWVKDALASGKTLPQLAA